MFSESCERKRPAYATISTLVVRLLETVAMAGEEDEQSNEKFPWHLGVYDAHCHPTDTVSSIQNIPGMKTRALTIMATRAQDQDLVADFSEKLALTKDSLLAANEQGRIVPAFGWHPWFSHQVYDDRPDAFEVGGHMPPSKIAHYESVVTPSPDDEQFLDSLPEPRSLSALLSDIRSHLERYPNSLVGEIGLDRAFRIPGTEIQSDHELDLSLTPGGREGRRFSPYRVDMGHQRKIMTAQLNLAGELRRAVSVHGVAAHGVVYDTLRNTWRGHEKKTMSKRARRRRQSVDKAHTQGDPEPNNDANQKREAATQPFPSRVCLHSYSGPPETLKQYLHPSVPATVFFSFSHLVNFSNPSKKAIQVIEAVPDDRILAESDLHAAGEEMDTLMEQIVRKICLIKGWSLEFGVKQLASNWMRFIFGSTGRNPKN